MLKVVQVKDESYISTSLLFSCLRYVVYLSMSLYQVNSHLRQRKFLVRICNTTHLQRSRDSIPPAEPAKAKYKEPLFGCILHCSPLCCTRSAANIKSKLSWCCKQLVCGPRPSFVRIYTKCSNKKL